MTELKAINYFGFESYDAIIFTINYYSYTSISHTGSTLRNSQPDWKISRLYRCIFIMHVRFISKIQIKNNNLSISLCNYCKKLKKKKVIIRISIRYQSVTIKNRLNSIIKREPSWMCIHQLIIYTSNALYKCTSPKTELMIKDQFFLNKMVDLKKKIGFCKLNIKIG